jgi:hypothetical protein
MMIDDIIVEVSDTTMLNNVQMPVTKKFSGKYNDKPQDKKMQ